MSGFNKLTTIATDNINTITSILVKLPHIIITKFKD